MNAPKWFWVVLAACAIVFVGWNIWHGRYEPVGRGPLVLDHWTGKVAISWAPQPTPSTDTVVH